MIDYDNLVSDKYYLQGVDEIKFAGSSQLVTLSVNGTEIFSETLEAGTDGSVILRDVISMLEPYFILSDSGIEPIQFKMHLGIPESKMEKTISVFYSARYSEHPLAALIVDNGSINSIGLYGEYKILYPDEKDLLSVVCSGEEVAASGVTAEIEVLTMNDSYVITKKIETSGTKLTAHLPICCEDIADDVFKEYGLSRSLYPDEMVNINVTTKVAGVEKRKICYIVSHVNLATIPQFKYINEYGEIDSVVLPGVIKKAHSVENNFNVCRNTMLRNMHSDKVVLEVSTGILDKSTKLRLQQMLRSPKLWFADGATFDEILITSIDDSELSADNFLYSAKFQFRFANLLKL